MRKQAAPAKPVNPLFERRPKTFGALFVPVFEELEATDNCMLCHALETQAFGEDRGLVELRWAEPRRCLQASGEHLRQSATCTGM